MNKKIHLIIFLLTSWTFAGMAQDTTTVENVYAEEDLYEDDPYFWSYSKEIGINMTGLISKFIPFNLGPVDAGLVGFKYKKYYSKRAFRFNFGSNFVADNDELNQFFLSLGIERRYPISKSKKVTYSSSWDLFLTASDDNGLTGISKGYGIEYHFSRRIYISTEAALIFGLGGEQGFVLRFNNPAAIFFHVRLY